MDARLLLTVLPQLSAIAALVLGAVVLAYGLREWPNRLLAASLALTALHQAVFGVASLCPSQDGGLPLMRVALGALAALPVAWLAFSLTFASGSVAASRRWRGILLGLAGGTLLAWTVLAMGRGVALGHLPSGQHAWTVDGPGRLVLGLVVLGSAVLLLQFENVYRHAGQAVRWRSKFLVVGAFVGFASQIVAASHAVLYGRLHPMHPTLGALAFLVGEGLIAFSLVRHRLLHVDVFVSRYVVYRSLTLALVGGYLLSLGAAAEVLGRLAIRLDAATGIMLASIGAAALALVLLSDEVRHRIQRHLHTHFYNHKYDYRLEWMEFTRRLSHAPAAPRIAAETLGRILDIMWVRQAAMYTVREPDELVLVHHINSGALPATLGLTSTVLESLREQAGLRRGFGQAVETTQLVAALLPRGAPVGLVVPVAALDMLVGILIVGPECSGKPFGVDDHDLLTAVATQAGALLLNARLARESAEGRELQVLARLSAFIAHDLKNAVAVLSLLTENARQHLDKPAFQRDAVQTLAQVTGRMRDLLAALATPSAQPATAAQPIELAPAVERWTRDLAALIPARIRLETALAWAGVVRADPEQLRSILQNLLLNAVDAIDAEGCIRVETGLAGDEAVLVVSDTGRGMSPEFIRDRLCRPFQTTKPRGLGIGLYQCRHYLASMGGTLGIDSEEGRGTRMTARLPAEPAGAPAAAQRRDAAASGPASRSLGEVAPAAALGRLT